MENKKCHTDLFAANATHLVFFQQKIAKVVRPEQIRVEQKNATQICSQLTLLTQFFQQKIAKVVRPEQIRVEIKQISTTFLC